MGNGEGVIGIEPHRPGVMIFKILSAGCGGLGLADVQAFIAAFSAGCP